MSYYFAIIGTQDNPLFEHEFGTSKQGGDGLSRFSDQARHLNQFILHSSLDVVEEVQWNNGQMCVFAPCYLLPDLACQNSIHPSLDITAPHAYPGALHHPLALPCLALPCRGKLTLFPHILGT